MEGWIKVHRQIKDHFIYKDSETLHVWMHILLNATHEGRQTVLNGKVVELLPGQMIFGRKKWSRDLNISESKIRSRIDLFVEAGMISKISNNKYSILTVKNWSEYQKNNHQSSQNKDQQNDQSDSLEITEEVAVNDQEKSHTDDQQKTTVKNEKNVKKDIYSIFEFWNEQKIVVHRKLTGKMETATKGALKDYSKDELQEAIANYSQIVKDSRYYFNHKWTLEEFVRRGLEKFMDGAVARENYLNGTQGIAAQKQEKENWRDTGRRF